MSSIIVCARFMLCFGWKWVWMNNGLRPSDRRGDRKRREEGLNIEVIISHRTTRRISFLRKISKEKALIWHITTKLWVQAGKVVACRELFATFARSSGMCFIRGRRCSSKLAVIEENGISRNHYPTASSDGYVHPDAETVYKCGFVTLIPIRVSLFSLFMFHIWFVTRARRPIHHIQSENAFYLRFYRPKCIRQEQRARHTRQSRVKKGFSQPGHFPIHHIGPRLCQHN